MKRICNAGLFACGFLLLIQSKDIVFSRKYSYKRRNFATKSRYPDAEEKTTSIPKECRPKFINMVLRHGTRYPGEKDVIGMNKLEDFINQFHVNSTIQHNLTSWRNRFLNGHKLLAATGAQELYNISKRIRRWLPSLFSPKYNGEEHMFVSTMTARTSQSASAFAFGLFEGTGNLGPSMFQPVAITTTNLTEPQLRFFDNCLKYQLKVSKNKKISLAEYNKFRDGQEILDLKRKLGFKLNIPDNISITTDHIEHMFLSCAFEVAIYGKGKWCSIFDDSDLDVIEYMYDLKNYWKRGYGFEINYQMSCLLLKNITESIENAIRSSGKTKAIFQFAHSETLIPLLCLMGLNKDSEPLLANNYHKQKNRLFRTSIIAPFSANIAIILYSCQFDMADSFHVQVLVNENVTPLPCCDGLDLCPLKEFRACFQAITNSCDYNRICDMDKPSHNDL
ncbi:multiple inositol polyphosphate phosphatase 1-like [Xenia sp. Carnegie-2017]|uniref:multiple inositol polyphosphate phosphatase 1-like n=1 Tax=Xenia sp. Carnegie-2017 TaxID=2897299 RepID=UPI001F0383F6|nr:multiple inositol polyphosphate phosphatase 1-like [Xenia sp. Carnegie-2017]